ncbi:MAG: hypothetical protein WC774_01305 [Candidatus Gracilibacteria bacterium]|jgi:hypothetical protein
MSEWYPNNYPVYNHNGLMLRDNYQHSFNREKKMKTQDNPSNVPPHFHTPHVPLIETRTRNSERDAGSVPPAMEGSNKGAFDLPSQNYEGEAYARS